MATAPSTTAPLDLSPLLAPFACKSLKVPNRFAMAPMTRYFSPDGILPEAAAAYYGRRAAGGVGFIISEGAGLDRDRSRAVPFVPSFSGDEALAGWGRALDAVHAEGCAMAPQLWHVGGVLDYNFPDQAHALLESPSGLAGPGTPGGLPMTEEDIADNVASFARAAGIAKAMGFDALEFHGAHGYLIDQFFWGATNVRTDAWGGNDIGLRARFAADIIKAVRATVGDDFALILRISQWKTGFYDTKLAAGPGELETWLRPLVDAGIDIFHCSQRRFWEPEFDGSDLNLAGWVKKVMALPTITVGSIGLSRDLFADFEQGGESAVNTAALPELLRRYERGDFDMVAIGRALLADPAWLAKVTSGRYDELTPYSVEAMQTLT